MQPIDRAQAQQRANDILVFQRELQRLDQEQAFRLEPAQARQLADYHLALLDSYRDRFDIDHDLRSQQLSLGMRVASFFGALAFAASVFLLFYRFWGLFPTVAQVAILIGSAFASFFATLWVQAKDASGYFSKLAAMVAFACFVLDLTMLGQIFNVTPSDLALVPWALYALLLAYLCNARLLLAAAILCVMGFIAARVGTWGGGYWLSVGERPENFFPAAALIFAVPLCFEQRNFRLRRDLPGVRPARPVPADAGAGQLGLRQLPGVTVGAHRGALPGRRLRRRRPCDLARRATQLGGREQYRDHLLRHLPLHQVLRLVVGSDAEVPVLPGARPQRPADPAGPAPPAHAPGHRRED